MRAVERHGLMRAIWQFPTVMLPLAIDGRGEVDHPAARAVRARHDAGSVAADAHRRIRGPILALPGVSGWSSIDGKPPGTISGSSSE
jgi:hypothetical protein